MNKIINIYKPVGMTPYQLIQQLRKKRIEYKDIPIGYAGRLDPLAQGVIVLMIGEETKNRDEYLKLPKEYEFEILFGVSTDTYDTLGLIDHEFPTLKKAPIDIDRKVEEYIKNKIGKQIQKYPPYSSKTVDGKPLFQWARENRLSEIKIPEREIEIYNIYLDDLLSKDALVVKKIIHTNIKKVAGDFRQNEILNSWDDFFKNNPGMIFTVARCKMLCSSGTYVRSLINEVGRYTGTGALALSITRTRVGDYILKDSLRL